MVVAAIRTARLPLPPAEALRVIVMLAGRRVTCSVAVTAGGRGRCGRAACCAYRRDAGRCHEEVLDALTGHPASAVVDERIERVTVVGDLLAVDVASTATLPVTLAPATAGEVSGGHSPARPPVTSDVVAVSGR